MWARGRDNDLSENNMESELVGERVCTVWLWCYNGQLNKQKGY